MELPPAPRVTLVHGLKGTIARVDLGRSVHHRFYAATLMNWFLPLNFAAARVPR